MGDLIPGLVVLVARAAVALGQGLAMLGLGALAAVQAAAGLVAGAVGRFLATLGDVLMTATPVVREIAPWLVRAGCVVAAAAGIWFAAPRLFMAYGGDGGAAIVTAVFAGAPTLAAWSLRRQWGTLLAAGGITAGIALLVEAMTTGVRALAVVVVMMVCVTYLVMQSGAGGDGGDYGSISENRG